MCTLERSAWLRLPAAEALRAEPALVIAHHLSAVGAVFQVGRHRRLWHSSGYRGQKKTATGRINGGGSLYGPYAPDEERLCRIVIE